MLRRNISIVTINLTFVGGHYIWHRELNTTKATCDCAQRSVLSLILWIDELLKHLNDLGFRIYEEAVDHSISITG